MFNVVEGEGRTYWVAGDGSSTYYKGQLLTFIAASKAQTYGTVLPLAVPAGAFDLTNMQVIAGVVTGFNYRTPKNVVTVGTIPLETGGGAIATQAQLAADEKVGNEGMYSKGDNQLLIQMTEITPDTIIRGPIYNAAYGTAPTLLTATAVGGTDGMVTADTTNACDFTNVAKCGTIYCRTGANAGIYRISKDTSTTAPSVNTAFPNDTAVGDTYVRVPFKQGQSTIYIAGPGLYIDCSKNPVIAGTDLFGVMVYKLNLAEAGKEYAEFRFNTIHFDPARA